MEPRPRAWWHRHLDAEERRRVMTELAVSRTPHWGWRFGVMITLSVVVAVMGLSADSAAVVIGAMLLAPLMQPVLAFAACLSMALFRLSLRMFVRVAVSTVWALFLAYLLAAIFLSDTGPLPDEVTSRTAPDVRDLVVALGAGAAGSYATVRKDASAALPGVAVAVALVPPLGVAGIALEAGNRAFLSGALLLYITNLVAIVLASVLVFVGTGFVPRRRLAMTSGRLTVVSGAVAIAVALIAVPLFQASTNAVERSNRQIEAARIVEQWLGEVQSTQSPTIEFVGETIQVGVRSFDSPPDSDPLIDALQTRFGVEYTVSVEWDRVERATTTTTTPPSTTIVSDEERLLNNVTDVVDQWLLDFSPEGAPHHRDALTINGSILRIDASGIGSPPSLSDLEQRLADQLGASFDVRLTWLTRETVDESEPTPVELLATQIRGLVEDWAAANRVIVTSFNFDGERAFAEVVGTDQPDAEPLVTLVDELTGGTRSIDVFFIQRIEISTTTTTTTTTILPPERIPEGAQFDADGNLVDADGNPVEPLPAPDPADSAPADSDSDG